MSGVDRSAENDGLAKAWDEGYEAGLDHETARAVDPDWPIRTPNPYRVTPPDVSDTENTSSQT